MEAIERTRHRNHAIEVFLDDYAESPRENDK